jgi:hypothetical protein
MDKVSFFGEIHVQIMAAEKIGNREAKVLLPHCQTWYNISVTHPKGEIDDDETIDRPAAGDDVPEQPVRLR